MLPISPDRRPLPYRGTMAISKLLAGCSAALMVFACTASPANTSPTAVPQDVRAQLGPTDTLLAYKAADLYSDGSRAAVIVVRHQASEKSDYDFDSNPCDLVVLHQVNGKLIEADHSSKAVDCTYNDVARHAPPMSLNDNLTVSPASIEYVNQKDKGDSTFYFAWSKEKAAWYLRRATASNPGSGTSVAHVSATYPKDLGWTPMSSVDPEAIAEVLEKQGKTNQ